MIEPPITCSRSSLIVGGVYIYPSGHPKRNGQVGLSFTSQRGPAIRHHDDVLNFYGDVEHFSNSMLTDTQ